MRFGKFREYRPGNDIQKYVEVDLSFNFKELFIGLGRLNFDDNFQSFRTTVSIPANSEVAIRNPLGIIPSGKILIKDGGSNDIVDGNTPWNLDYVYLQNLNVAGPITVTAVFFA